MKVRQCDEPRTTDTPIGQSVTPSRYLPLSRNRKFVGRKEELGLLQRKLFVNRDCEKVAVFGLGGIGKTQVVLNFAYWVLDEHPDLSVFWVPALSAETFEQAYGEIARLLEIPGAAEGKADVKELVRRYISAGKAGKWMMIVDNADKMSIPDGSAGKAGILRYGTYLRASLARRCSRRATPRQLSRLPEATWSSWRR